jgi:hypothetical protein
MKLAEQIDAMRARMVEEHEFSLNQLDHLEKRMLTGDAEIMRKIESIKALQTRNATDIVRSLLTVANRVGYLPAPASVAPPPLPPVDDEDQAQANVLAAEYAMAEMSDPAGAVH